MKNEQKLIEVATKYVSAFRNALVKSEEEFKSVIRSNELGFSTGTYGTVVFTDELVDAGQQLAVLARKIYGTSKVHDKSVEEAARAVLFVSNSTSPVKNVAEDVAKSIVDAVTKTHRIIRPNQVFQFAEDVQEVVIGPVRIVRRETLSAEIEAKHRRLRIVEPTSDGSARSIVETDDGELTQIHIGQICWDVAIQGMPKKIEGEALWLIDVATSFVRLHFDSRPGLFPGISDTEPHPIAPHQWTTEGMMISDDDTLNLGGSTSPTWYLIDLGLATKLSQPNVTQLATRIFEPISGSVGERMQQVLGWMSRARQAKDPAERVLLFFTALEALLSSPSKDSPITDTIARGASVIWSSNYDIRWEIYNSIKKLYSTRSKIVHNGYRSVAEIEANTIHYFVWNISYIVLNRVGMHESYTEFLSELKQASFGREWKPST